MMFPLILILPALALAGDDFTDVTYHTTPLGAGVHVLEGAGGNVTALVTPDGTFLVDDDFAPMAPKLVAKLRELGGDSPRFIVNTHFHYDHSGGNEVFGPTATILAASAARERLTREQTLWHEQHPAEPPRAWPTLTYDHAVTVHLGDEAVRVEHLPRGHTDGDSVAFFGRAHVVAMGDLYFSGMYPIFHPEHDGSLDGYVRNVARVLAAVGDDWKVVPGHGATTGRAELARYLKMIRASIATVRKGLRRGLTLEQLKKAGLPAEWEPFSHGYVTTDRWIERLHAELAGPAKR